MKVFQTVTLGLALCLSAVVHAAPRDVVTDAGENQNFKRFDLDVSYNAETKDLTIDYKMFTSSRCGLVERNVSITAEKISFKIAKAPGFCLTALGYSIGQLVVPNFGPNPAELVIDGQSYGYVRLNDKGEAEVVAELPKEEAPEAAAEQTYNIELEYDAATKNLVINYKTVQLTSSICHYEAKNLEVSTRTPTLVGPVAVGVISFDTDEVSEGICLTAFGHSGGSVTIDAFSGAPTALIIDGVSYGFLALAKNGETVELVQTLLGSSISQ